MLVEIHQVNLVEYREDGSRHWECLTCGEQFVIEEMPYKKTVIVAGNKTVLHSGRNSVDNASLEFEVDVITPKEKRLFDQWSAELDV